MPKNISWRKLVQKMRRLGFDGPYPGKRHFIMTRGRLKIAIPNYHGSDISKNLVAALLREAGISQDDWENA